MSTKAIHPREKLARDMQAVITDTEALLKATAGQAGDKIEAVRARAMESLSAAKARIEEFEQAAMDRVKAADSYVHENPWPVIAIGAGVGFLLGWAVARK